MQAKNFKMICNEAAREFEHILNSTCYSDFKIVNDENTKGQIFILQVFYGEEYLGSDDKVFDHVNLVRPVLRFKCNGLWENSTYNINKFFRINDEIFDEFYELGCRGDLDRLVSVLKKGNELGRPKNIGQTKSETYFFFEIISQVVGADDTTTDLLDESIATIGLRDDSNSIEVSCAQSERQQTTLLRNGSLMTLSVPYDKLPLLNSNNSEDEIRVDGNYIFIIMSFGNDPFLQDTNKTIKRTIHKINKNIKCERADDIQDDFTITEMIINCIRKAKILVVDTTENRPNVYYELGYARALGKKVILIAREGEKPHFDISTQNIIFYNNQTTLEQSLTKRLRAMLKS